MGIEHSVPQVPEVEIDPLERVALTFSGGIDSTVLAYYLLFTFDNIKHITLLPWNYGQAMWKVLDRLYKYHLEELRSRYKAEIEVKVIEIEFPEWMRGGLFESGFVPPYSNPKHHDYSTEQMTYDYCLVPGRNAILMTITAGWCSLNRIQTLFTGHQNQPDEWRHLGSYRHRTEDFGTYFLDRMNLILEVGFPNPVRIEAPWIAQRASKEQIVSIGKRLGINLDMTYSCQFYPECGKCDGCVPRKRILG